MNPWISVKDKLPHDGEKVIAWGNPGGGIIWTDDGKHVIFDLYRKKEGWASGWEVRWWMPMPPKPEGETGRA